MKILKFKWIGIKLNPTFFLGLQKGRNEEEDKKEWTNIESNESFYTQEGKPSREPWDVREATRAIKEMHIDD